MARIPIEHQVPIDFALPYDPARIQPATLCRPRGDRGRGARAFRTDTIHPVLTRGAGEEWRCAWSAPRRRPLRPPRR